ncbi:DNA-binding response OmpR family regulator [Pedobacter cryoconitis]|uniref:DNA-binding response OmpR family regulator n=1 Tax=Pedobacter cryoconitis TaxID=188932 RepID=A0A7W9DXD7_9SPHI|nr:response regulator [Pedobacter cryoconitis]MBB5634763.1 DNA-binding response OmpR family regulator [Pedobacter cryoconitis]
MKKVIVQDTDFDLLETLTFLLEDASFEVLPILHYKDVAAQISSFNPHLVLLDFRLSGVECTCLCESIKKDFPELPVLALSCNYNIQKEYASAGFDDYISKPFDIDHLLAVLGKY